MLRHNRFFFFCHTCKGATCLATFMAKTPENLMRYHQYLKNLIVYNKNVNKLLSKKGQIWAKSRFDEKKIWNGILKTYVD